ncbi:MAG: endonuclease III domain-containing protein [Candidatus Hodarchaeales archaeon]
MVINIDNVVEAIREKVKPLELPVVDRMAREGKSNPFRILVCTMLSSRTKDSVTNEACKRLWDLAQTPGSMLELSVEEIEQAIYPVGFYRNKARNLKVLCEQLVKEFGSEVPDKLEELVKLKGVGRKTANLVLTLGFRKLGICVDTHVHRFFNRLDYVKTNKPEETEIALRKKLPKRYWIEINGLIVSFGQNVCKPISPWCSKCPINNICPRKGVDKSR